MANKSTLKNVKQKKLSTKIALISGGILVCVFTILICFNVYSSKKALNETIVDEFQILAKLSGTQVQQIIDTAESAASDIQSYLLKAYGFSAEGKRNMLEQDFRPGETKELIIQSKMYMSLIYDTGISEMSSDVEKYMIETARHLAKENADIVGVGVMFEPYAFDSGIKDYAFYISETEADKPVEPFGTYSDYSNQTFYKEAAQAKETVFVDPYEFNGMTMVTASIPIYYEGKLNCVVMIDVNVTNFSKVGTEIEKYPTMYTTILNEKGTIVYDSESAENIGNNLTAFFMDQKELETANAGIASGQEFRTTITDSERVMEAFFYPIEAGNGYWWAVTALDRDDMNRDIVTNTYWMIAMSIAALCVTAGSILILLKKTLKPIEGIVQAAESIADGDLDIHLTCESNDEIGRLERAFSVTVTRLKAIIGDTNELLEAMANGNFDIKTKTEESYAGQYRNLLLSMRKINVNLSNTLSQINESSNQVSSGSDQVSSGAQALSQGATEQASSVEELAATINDISFKVKSNAENADAAKIRANKVGDEIINSNQQMQEMIEAMNKISLKSNEIGKIIKAIEDIAFQTNILALNAAVEAARAGAAGKGFAVVADEVRNLASKSAEASKSTAILIEDSINAVQNGTKIADETAQSLIVVVDGAKEVADLVNKISEASNAQADAITQVTMGVDQISSVVQTNSATAEQSAAASEELSGQAQLLKNLVSRFNLKQEDNRYNLPTENEQNTNNFDEIQSDSQRSFKSIDKY